MRSPGPLTRFNVRVTFIERVTAYRDRHPRTTALLILGLLLGVLIFDGFRVSAARGKLPSLELFQGVLFGLVTGAVFLILAAVLWFVARRYGSARSTIEIVAAVAVVLLFVLTHPRYQDDTVGDTAELGFLIGVDMLFTGLVIYAATYRWTRQPLVPLK